MHTTITYSIDNIFSSTPLSREVKLRDISEEMESKDYVPLFETKPAKGRILFRLYAASVFVAICMIFVYRASYFPSSLEGPAIERWAWSGMFLAELWFSWYEKYLPGIDVFVCTADPVIEPPTMVINTVLSVMAYDYPPEKLSVYLSDDGGSDLTFYAMLEASRFAKEWIPFCKKLNAEPRSPEAYFQSAVEPIDDPIMAKQWQSIKKLYEDMNERIETATKLGRLSEDTRKEHKGFREWDFVLSRRDHQTILQILIDGRDPKAVDIEGQRLPTLVYLAREKRPQFPHHFKAGAMNALIRVSSGISNGSIILNVDCDMYSNNSAAVRDALCFFMDEKQSHNVAYVQFPQNFSNPKKNDLYGSSLMVIMESCCYLPYQLELPGIDSNGGPCYIGTGCFHRRETLCGKKYGQDCKTTDWIKTVNNNDREVEESAVVLEESCKVLASCSYEENTLWGKEMGLMYDIPVEDIMTGLAIQCRGWRSIYHTPERKAFLGLAPTTLGQSLVQHKRWAEGDFQIFLSSYCPFLYGRGKIPLKLQLAYCLYLMWAPYSLPTLYYVFVPSLRLLRGISLFPKISSPWVMAFAYAMLANRAYSLGEFIWVGGTVKGWWNDKRMWMFKRTTSYFFGFAENILRLLGFTKSSFEITAKVAEEDISERFEQETMEFGASSPMFTILATIALLNLFSFLGGLKREMLDGRCKILDQFVVQMLLSGVVVLINLPLYQGLFFRNDNGRMPSSVTFQSTLIALLVCTIAAC
ncbi:cellulose synthase-like protein E1 isoform X2 [Pistacia vera]|uniref:cellulose synthase-like protein E1 isoform X2 n=1 Tax=Pistacia vera TaxID=55513 RepID=UPI001263472C|nr:cellulose synthase-like protein E1 isoform X2 [Pistacia vera]